MSESGLKFPFRSFLILYRCEPQSSGNLNKSLICFHEIFLGELVEKKHLVCPHEKCDINSDIVGAC